MPQSVETHALVDPGPLRGDMHGAVELPRGEGFATNPAGKQPLPRSFDEPPPPQQIEQLL